MITSNNLDGDPHPFETAIIEPQKKVDPLLTPIIRFLPESDELLSSWLFRLAWMNAEKIHTFRKRCWNKTGSPWNRNINLPIDTQFFQNIANLAQTNYERLFPHTLLSLEGILFEKVKKSGKVDGVLASRHYAYGNNRPHHSLQYCTECIQEQTTVHFKRTSMITYLVGCPKHRNVYRDTCYKCGHPVKIHLSDSGQKYIPRINPVSFCHYCGSLWGQAPKQELPELSDDFWSLQGKIQETLHTNWFQISGGEQLYALSFFNGLRHIIRYIMNNTNTASLREIVARELGILPLGFVQNGYQGRMDSLSIGDRVTIMQYVSWLLSEWPSRFNWALKKSGISYSYLCTYRDEFPYWLAKEIWQTKDVKHTTISKDEYQAAGQYLQQRGLDPNRFAINKLLCRWYTKND